MPTSLSRVAYLTMVSFGLWGVQAAFAPGSVSLGTWTWLTAGSLALMFGLSVIMGRATDARSVGQVLYEVERGDARKAVSD